MPMFLGMWHTYKEVCNLTWQYFLPYLFAPGIHAIHGDQSIMLKPKLAHIETYFIWFLKAFDINPTLKHLIKAIEQGTAKEVMLDNILHLRKTIIPRLFDFSIALQQKDGRKIIDQLPFMAFMCATYHEKTYCKSILIQMELFRWWESTNSPLLNLYLQHATSFNEIQGEYSLSKLDSFLSRRNNHSV